MQVIPSATQTYAFDEQEAKLAKSLNALQIANLSNYRAAAVEARLALQFEASNPQGLLEFVQQEAYQKGRIDLIAILIEESQLAASNPQESQS